MLVNIHHDTRREHARLLVAGIGFITAMAVLIALSIAIYNKTFVDSTMVTIKADRAGQQLAKFGDVRLHGVLVGRVDSVKQDGKRASIKVALEPDQAKRIPDNVSVEILPTTLFGQKYISLVDPARPSSTSLRDGTVIPASQVTTNVELAQILANLFPLLRAIRPADLNTTLTALATALQGRGDQLGRTLSDLDDYLTTVNAHMPTVKRDLTLLSRVAKTYSLAAPDLVDVLRNATTTARTVSTMDSQLEGFFTGISTLARTGTRVLATNEKNIVREGRLAVPLLDLLDTYSPMITCTLVATSKYTDRLNEIFENAEVNQTMDLSAKQRPPYTEQDKPEYGDIGRGPSCYGLPNPPVPYQPPTLSTGYNGPQQGGPQQ